MAKEVQSYGNHRRLVPAYHFVGSLLLLVNLIYSIVELIRNFSIGAVVGFLTAVALIIVFYYSRTFALTVQDRLICLEMRLRLERVLPEDLRSRLGELSPGQLIGLRFAGDDELPDLTRRVLEEGIQNREVIKKSVRNWQPDTLRV